MHTEIRGKCQVFGSVTLSIPLKQSISLTWAMLTARSPSHPPVSAALNARVTGVRGHI